MLPVVWCRQVASPGVNFNTPGLLQLITQRQPVPTPTSRPKRRSTPHHQQEKVRSHHARPAAAIYIGFQSPTCIVLVYKALHDLLPAYRDNFYEYPIRIYRTVKLWVMPAGLSVLESIVLVHRSRIARLDVPARAVYFQLACYFQTFSTKRHTFMRQAAE